MKIYSAKGLMLASSVLGGAVLLAMASVAPARAQTASTVADVVQEVVVTGSRIRRVETNTEAPVTIIDAQTISDRGFVSAGQALNELTATVPSFPQADGSGASSGSGQQFPNLFGLGAGRTLTLVNGRRFVTSSRGFGAVSASNPNAGERVVDTNIIPTGLIERIDVVQAGGAAVYGSDAIAGVINYVLKDNFQGLEFDAYYGLSSRDYYPQSSLHLTRGRNFLD
ncbi:MAG TPA: TonB-dependent receptor plug domain-containing protein, partial [Phenylobacterium sp.]|nr:TonB-dependent receptor plug domain-containing protein [Phenylobacterium sp.]